MNFNQKNFPYVKIIFIKHRIKLIPMLKSRTYILNTALRPCKLKASALTKNIFKAFAKKKLVTCDNKAQLFLMCWVKSTNY